ncbi:MAG: hypothetical protein ACLPTF_26060 [Steroidobacteraceae bacterium]
MNVLRPVLTEYQLKESTLYLLYADRKHMPFTQVSISQDRWTIAIRGSQRYSAVAAQSAHEPPLVVVWGNRFSLLGGSAPSHV